MEIKPEYEVFGRRVPFDQIRNIRQVFQPGILNASHFFNPDSLKRSLLELCCSFDLFRDPKEVLVYFNDLQGITLFADETKKKWR